MEEAFVITLLIFLLLKHQKIASEAGVKPLLSAKSLNIVDFIIFSELKSNTAIDIYRRNLQKVFVSRVIDVALSDKTATGNFDGKRISVIDTDIPSIAKGQLLELKAQLKKASAVATDRLTKCHLNDMVARIENAMKPKQ